MNASEIEQKKIVKEWLDKAKADLESAEILFKESKNYDVVVYHAHQAVEKYFKAKLLEAKKVFKFVHDLNSLFYQAAEILPIKDKEEDVSFLNSLYPKLRYPTGEEVNEEEAQRSLKIAGNILAV